MEIERKAMARKHSLLRAEAHEEEDKKGDAQTLLDLIKESPGLFAGGAVFIAVCAIVGIFYRMYSDNVDRERTAEYARALDIEDPLEQSEALWLLAESRSAISAEALYLSGEMAFRGADAEKAEAAFARLREEFPDFEFTPDAIEGLGYIHEDAGNYIEAVIKYEEVLEKFPNSFAGQRQWFNIGRSRERAGEIQGAIDAYRAQLLTFQGSNVYRRAQAALDRLRESDSERFSDGSSDSETLGVSAFESLLESAIAEPATDSTEEDSTESPAEDMPEESTESEPVDTAPDEAESTDEADTPAPEDAATDEEASGAEEASEEDSPAAEEEAASDEDSPAAEEEAASDEDSPAAQEEAPASTTEP